MIDEDFTHDMGGYGDKSSSILPFRVGLPSESKIGFIDQRRGLKRVVRPFIPQVGRREPPELAIKEGNKPFRRLLRTGSGSSRLCIVGDESSKPRVLFWIRI